MRDNSEVQNKKLITFLLLVGALVSLIFLSASLSNLQLHSGTPFPGRGGSGDDIHSVVSIFSTQVYSVPLLPGILAFIFLVTMFYVPVRLLSYANLRAIFRELLIVVTLLILIYLLPDVTPNQPTYVPNGSSEVTTVPSLEYPTTPLGQPPRILILFVIFIMVLGIGLLVFVTVRRRWNTPKIEIELLKQAEDAVDALQAGMDLRNVIIRCYLQMTFAIQEAQRIERNETMTAREFEDWLEQKGFPTMPLHQLTSLFERVRYSEQLTSIEDEKIATDSLNEIIQFCRDGRV